MKIENLQIRNFRGISEVAFSGLGSMVIIAGQNGSGKSCIFDAIRLLKSVYGGYQANEWQQWMGEFQIALGNRASDFAPIFNDQSQELRIACDFRISESERRYIQSNASDLLKENIWRTLVPEAFGRGSHRAAMFAAQFRDREPEVAARAALEHEALMRELAAVTVRGEFFISPGDTPKIENSLVLPIVFSTFLPQEIGVVDYHGAQRHFGRENVQGINLNLAATEEQRSQTALYNYANKYNNVKSEMAASYIKEILAEQAGVPMASQATLTNTLKELFATFFPDKNFLGPQPTAAGSLVFPVKVSGTGRTHDLDELSAGEKEILYGYLRIRNSAPQNSIILLDEPELHLNPRLARGLPRFYQKNLGEKLQNQIWLVTHSDALLREVVGRANYNVFHMLPCGNVSNGESQLKPLSATADLDLALVDLVGDLASYRPGGKVLILEGGGDSDFDQRVISTLFPEISERANLISGTNKVRVQALLEILESAAVGGELPIKFFSVTDKDSGVEIRSQASSNSFTWDVYHIENYFLVASYVRRVLQGVRTNVAMDEAAIWDELRDCARETLPQMVRHEIGDYANRLLVAAINTRTDPRADDLSAVLSDSIVRSLRRLEELRAGQLSRADLASLEETTRAKYVASLSDGTWHEKFRGRDVLKRFVARQASQVSYEVFRNLVLAQMKDDGYRPLGMKAVIDRILAA